MRRPSDAGQAFSPFVAQALLSSHFSQLGAPLATLDPKLWRGFSYILLRSAKGVCHTPLTHTSHTSHAAHSTRGAQVLLVESAQDDGGSGHRRLAQRRASRSRATTGRIFIDAMADTCSRAIHVHAKTPFGCGARYIRTQPQGSQARAIHPRCHTNAFDKPTSGRHEEQASSGTSTRGWIVRLHCDARTSNCHRMDDTRTRLQQTTLQRPSAHACGNMRL